MPEPQGSERGRRWPDYMRDRCVTCGRYVSAGGPGVSWCQTHDGLWLNDVTFRCSPCTDRLGVRESNCNPASGPWSGRNPKPLDPTPTPTPPADRPEKSASVTNGV